MNGPGRLDSKSPQPAAEGGGFGPSLGYLIIAALLVVGGIVYWMTLPSDESPAPAAPATPSVMSGAVSSSAVETSPAATSTAVPGVAGSAPQRVATREPAEHDADPTTDLRAYLNKGEAPPLGEVISRLNQAGVYTGIGAFNPPNTKPKLVGLAVPEDFVLPDGYVRHYQATDDGQPIEPILMFAPDRPALDAAGRPIAVPPNRIVPPELAPPGMPIRRIVIPPALAADKPAN
jgi:hypothetical protein